MTLLDLTPGLKKTASTAGGEWAGPCPFCGGRDRFRVWPNEGTTGRYWCRSCGKRGDEIQLLRDRDGLSFREACERLEVNPSLIGTPSHHRTATGTTWGPKPAAAPGDAWQTRAACFLAGCQKTLAGPSGTAARSFLAGRGLTPATIEAAGLGWNMADKYESREAWGLKPETKEDGRPRRVWLPAGLVIPCFAGGRLVRLRVRRPEPGDGPRYVVVPGSASVPMIWGAGTAWVVVESELDGLLLHQEAGDLAGVISMGNAQTRPDAETDQALKAADLLLIALDSDAAGAKEAWGFWKRTHPNAKRWPIPNAKDPTEAKIAGLDLRSWVRAGLPDPEPITSTPEPTTATRPAPAKATARQEPPGTASGAGEGKDQGEPSKIQYRPIPKAWRDLDEGTIERLCIATIDGGLTDHEAERRVLH